MALGLIVARASGQAVWTFSTAVYVPGTVPVFVTTTLTLALLKSLIVFGFTVRLLRTKTPCFAGGVGSGTIVAISGGGVVAGGVVAGGVGVAGGGVVGVGAGVGFGFGSAVVAGVQELNIMAAASKTPVTNQNAFLKI